jgi:hypothetical protein
MGILSAPFVAASGLKWAECGYSRALYAERGALTVTAFNFWWVLTRILPQCAAESTLLGVPCQYVGMALAGLPGAVTGLTYLLGTRPRPLAGVAAAHLTACFFFLPGMNERFLVYGVGAICAWAAADARARAPAVVLSLCQVVNLLHNALWVPESRWFAWVPHGFAAPLSWACAVAVAGVIGWCAWRVIRTPLAAGRDGAVRPGSGAMLACEQCR